MRLTVKATPALRTKLIWSLFMYINKEENLTSSSLIKEKSLTSRNVTLPVPLYVVKVERESRKLNHHC